MICVEPSSISGRSKPYWRIRSRGRTRAAAPHRSSACLVLSSASNVYVTRTGFDTLPARRYRIGNCLNRVEILADRCTIEMNGVTPARCVPTRLSLVSAAVAVEAEAGRGGGGGVGGGGTVANGGAALPPSSPPQAARLASTTSIRNCRMWTHPNCVASDSPPQTPNYGCERTCENAVAWLRVSGACKSQCLALPA